MNPEYDYPNAKLVFESVMKWHLNAFVSGKGMDIAGQNEDLALEYVKKSCTVYTPTPAERNTFRKRSQKPCVKWLKANLDHPQWVDELLKLAKKH